MDSVTAVGEKGADELPKKSGYSSKSLGSKIAAIICLVLLVVFLLIAKWVEIKQTDTIRADAERETRALAETLHAGLRILMLNGDGELTNDWLESIKNLGGIEYIQIIRADGTQAFRGLETIQAVNQFIGSEKFSRELLANSEGFDVQEHASPLQIIKKEMQAVTSDEPGFVKLWMPILKEESCNACHGYDSSLLRGVLHVEVSTAEAEASIIQVRKVLWLSALIIALSIGLILWWLLNRIVLQPVESLSKALKDLGQGESGVQLPVTRADELGDVARSFMVLEKSWESREARLNLILNTIPEAVVTVSSSGDILTVNRAATEMFGYEANRMLDYNILNLLGPVSGAKLDGNHDTLVNVSVADLSQTLRECVGFHEGKGVFPVEVEVCSLEESYLLMLSDIDLYDMKKSNKFLFFLRDMTVRRRAEADMQLLATVVDQASEAIVICNPEGDIEYVNPAFHETTGFSAEEAIGKNPSILKSGDRGHDYYKKMWDSLKSGKVWRDVFVNKRKDGKLYQSEQRIAPMHDSFGHISHYVSIQRDITKEKGLQEQVEHLQRLESLGVLAGGIAHDFNNILACVIGNAEVMGYELPEKSPLHEYLGFIQEASTRGESLCLELMAYAGKGKRKTEPVNLSEVVQGIANILDTTASKQINLDVQMAASAPMIMADSTQLEQVVMNLVINATEAMPDGRGNVTIITSVESVYDDWFESSSFHSEKLADGEYVCLTVTDDGIGMDNVTVNQIFDPFFTTKFTGRGLGMSAVLGIIQNHHGSLKCNSTLGVGTSFSILFPILETEQKELPKEDEKSVSKAFKGKGNVLVIDDEPAVAKVAGRMLETMGFDVTLVHDAREGLEVLTKLDVVAVMVDMSMPHMDGPSFIKAFRETDQTTPIVICSGDAQEDVKSRVDESVVNCLIRKPFRYNDLSEAFFELFPEV